MINLLYKDNLLIMTNIYYKTELQTKQTNSFIVLNTTTHEINMQTKIGDQARM